MKNRPDQRSRLEHLARLKSQVHMATIAHLDALREGDHVLAEAAHKRLLEASERLRLAGQRRRIELPSAVGASDWVGGAS